MILSKTVTLYTNQDHVDILSINNEFAQAKISLFGGHILGFIPRHDGRNRLWLSKRAILNGSHPICGGVPICWPWFGEYKESQFQSHGYVRTQPWHVINCSENEFETVIKLAPDSCNDSGFNGSANLVMIVSVGRQLKIELITKNIGREPFEFNCALHSYFRVDDIAETELQGLSGNYSDKTRDWEILSTPTPYRFSEETDRIHHCPSLKARILLESAETLVESIGHDSLVVWNPWQEKSIAMTDMADDSYLTMLCVETAITHGQLLNPGKEHQLTQRIS